VTLLVLPASNGADDTAAIQAKLDAAAAVTTGAIVCGVPGQTYKTSAPLILSSGTTLDMTGCVVQLKAGSDTNMLRSKGVTVNARGVVDGATTAASTTLTSATANFVAGDVGKRIRVYGAGTSGAVLDTTIASVTSSTAAVLNAAAVPTATGLYVAIGSRDTDITVIGGTWDRGNNQGADTLTNRCNFVFLRGDRIKVRGTTHKSTAGKYAILLADVGDFQVTDTYLDTFASDGIHINGPSWNGTIDGVYGTSGDDAAALLEQEPFAAYDITRGRNNNITLRRVIATSTTVGIKLNCSGNVAHGPESDVVIDGCDGGVRFLGEGAAGGAWGTIQIVNSRGIFSAPNSTALAKTIRTVQMLNHNGRVTANFTGAIDLRNNLTVERLLVNGMMVYTTATQDALLRLEGATSVVRYASITNSGMSASGTDARLVSLHTNATLTHLALDNVNSEQPSNNGPMVDYPAGTTVERVDMRGVRAKHSFLVQNNPALEITIVGCVNPGGGSVSSSTASTLYGTGIPAGQPAWRQDAGTIHPKSLDWQVELRKVAKAKGNVCYNTDGALTCGTGPVVCDGTNWKNLYTGATY
jgi:hypothetical protein